MTVEEALLEGIAATEQGRPIGTVSPSVDVGWRIFDAQATSRHLDAAARRLQAEGRGFYTISSAGHESNAMVALALRPTDPALLHYRSGAFYLARAAQVEGTTPISDVLQGLMCAAAEPVAGGRHKVFGHPELWVIPQTSTIASHLPRALGLAMSLHRAGRLGVSPEAGPPQDAVVVCSFGDASANHSTATGAINAALNAAYRGLPTPLLFVCEDNGLGISVPTPPGWIESAYSQRPGLTYRQVDGSDTAAVLEAATEIVDDVRGRRRPGFLHLRTVRFGGHAGSDAEISYRTPTEIAADHRHDPLLGTARFLAGAGVAPEEILARYRDRNADVEAVLSELAQVPLLASAAEVVAPLAPRTPAKVAHVAESLVNGGLVNGPDDGPDDGPRDDRSRDGRSQRDGARTERGPFSPTARDGGGPESVTLAEAINATLAEALAGPHGVIVFGEDTGRKGGVYGVTRGLQRRFGAARVFDTVLDEQSILGLALGAGLAGLLPIPEIQYLAYLHNAEDQLRGEAATLSFFSNAQYRNPMVVRIAGLAYQRGFGGHFHNDNAVGVLRDIPGLVVACPSRADDAAAMLRTCLAAGVVDGTVSAYLEPIALYHARDLHEPGDDRWLASDNGGHIPIGRARVYHPGDEIPDSPDRHGPDHDSSGRDSSARADATIITFGNGVPMSLCVAARLLGQGLRIRVVDLRWLAPLPVEDILREAYATGRVLVADETRHSGGVGEGVITALVDAGFDGPMARVASVDSFVPLGPAAEHVLLGEADIEAAARSLATRPAASASTNGTSKSPQPLREFFTHRRREKRHYR